MPIVYLSDRGVIRVSGDDARGWLNNLVTCDVAGLTTGETRWGALLTPQGKILFDFLISLAPEEDGGGFLLDTPRALVPDLIKRLTLYRLRAKIVIGDLSQGAAVIARWNESGAFDGIVARDMRDAALGERIVADHSAAAPLPGSDAYHAHRISLGIPEGGKDFIYGDTFPHEANMDQLGGVDFKKGCYIGQEVVSRMEHRGSGGRARVVPVEYDGGFGASEGAEVTAGGRVIGSTGSQANGHGLAKLRLDRVDDALKAGEPILAGGIPIKLVKPDWATFRFPGEADA